MNGLCEESVALDSNVFIHLLNPKNNKDEHIDRLLGALAADQLSLLIDDQNYIASEYQRLVLPIVQNTSDTGIQVQLLRYWMVLANRETVNVVKTDPLWKAVLKVIHERPENADRCFVCVAFLKSKPLVTNDELHILTGPSNELGGPRGSSRRKRLGQIAKRQKLIGLLYNSVEAASQV